MNDETILLLLRGRDQAGLEQLEKKYHAYALRVALRFLVHREDAEECVNDVLFNIWNWDRLDQVTDLKGFLAGLIRRRAVDRLRSQEAEKRSRNMQLLIEEIEELGDPRESSSPEATVDLSLLLQDFVRGMSDTDRYLFLQRYYYGAEISEIAAQVRCSERAVYHRLALLRQDLKQKLEA